MLRFSDECREQYELAVVAFREGDPKQMKIHLDFAMVAAAIYQACETSNIDYTLDHSKIAGDQSGY